MATFTLCGKTKPELERRQLACNVSHMFCRFHRNRSVKVTINEYRDLMGSATIKGERNPSVEMTSIERDLCFLVVYSITFVHLAICILVKIQYSQGKLPHNIKVIEMEKGQQFM